MRPRKGEGIDCDQHHQREQDRQADLAELLDARFHAEGDDRDGEAEEGQVETQRRPGPRDKALERAAHSVRRRVDEIQPERLDQVFQRPAAHDTVVGDDPQGREYHQKAQVRPLGAFAQRDECAPAVRAGPSADDRFRKKDGQGNDQGGGDVDDDEGGTAVLAHQVREPPDVAEADGAAGKSHDDSHPAAEILAFFHVSSSFFSGFTGGGTLRIRR